MAFLSFSAKPSNSCCSVVSVLTLVPRLIPKLKIRNPNERQFFQKAGINASKSIIYILVKNKCKKR